MDNMNKKLISLKNNIKNLFEQYVFLIGGDKTHHEDFYTIYQEMPKSANKIFKEISVEEVLDIFEAIFIDKKGGLINKDIPIVLSENEAENFAEEMISFLKMYPLKYKANISVELFFEGLSQIKVNNIVCNFSGEFLEKNVQEYYLPSSDQQGLCFFEEGLCINNRSLVFKKVLCFLKFFVQQGLYVKLYIKKKDEMKQSLSDLSNLAKFAAIWRKPKKEVIISSVHMICLDPNVSYFDKIEIKLPSDICYFLSKLKFDNDNEGFNEGFIRGWLLQLSSIIKKPHDSESAETSIISASNWCFDSYVAEEDNVTQAFLNICFGLEALFGKKNDWHKPGVGIADGIRIKCSYLISKNVSERKMIMEDINNMYALRSDLVHGRKLFLEEKELTLFNKGRSFLERSIAAEIKLLNF